MFREIGVLVVIFAIGFSTVKGLHVPLKDSFEDQLADDLLTYIETGNQTVFLQTHLDHVQFPVEGRIQNLYKLPKPLQTPGCIACRVAIGIAISILRTGASEAEFLQKSISLCRILGFGESIVCRRAIQFHYRAVIYIALNSKGLSAEFICGNIWQGTCTHKDMSRNWSVKIDDNGPAITGSKDNIPETTDQLTIVHITDTHYDPKYQIGSNAVCNFPLCCRIEHGIPSNPEHGAGKWSDYRVCDMPWHSLDDLFNQIRKTHKDIDIIYVTGDYVDHASWDTSFNGNNDNTKKTMDAIRATFPNIPIFPTLGNHEAHPMNLFSPNHVKDPRISSGPLYRFIADAWNFLPDSSLDTLSREGYYTASIRPGLRVVALQNNLCNTGNYWNLYDTDYMQSHLQWVHDVLLEAEKNNEKVHIIGHMVSGGVDCVSNWGKEYRRVVDRFWNTISGQFFGHTHQDEFSIFYSREHPNYAINVAWNGGSATPFTYVNPNYRVYSVEKQTFQVTDHETWIYNLTEANLGDGPPRWFKEYTFKNAFSVPNLSPASLDQLAENFSRNDSLLYKYWEYYGKSADPHLNRGCNRRCLDDKLCQIVTTEFYDQTKCDQLTSFGRRK